MKSMTVKFTLAKGLLGFLCVCVCLFAFIFIYLFLNFYYYSITVVCRFSPSLHPTSAEPPSPTSTLPLDFVHVSFIVVPVITSPHCPLSTPPCRLLDCSSRQCLWLYVVCFFLLLIMFELKVRSYGICPSPPGLFHLA